MKSTIVLASRSKSRKELLKNAGIAFKSCNHLIDEAKEKEHSLKGAEEPSEIAKGLAIKKAFSVMHKFENALIIGSDQILTFNETIVSKPKSSGDLIKQISMFEGLKHTLYSSSCVLKGGKLLWSHTSSAVMTMRHLSLDDIERYVKDNWSDIKNSIGGYHIEGQGIRLFSSIKGDYFTVRGIPLLELVNFLISDDQIKC
ncbi:MAG: Maf family protein [Paracoccaceae bacterium]